VTALTSGALAVRPLGGPVDDSEIRRIFRATVVLGRPVPFRLPDLDHYEDLCLGWYLSEGRRWAAVLVSPEGVAGYVLVCPDNRRHDRWLRPRALRFTARVLTGMATGRYTPMARRFWRLRLEDGWHAWRGGVAAPMPAHVHFNLDPGVRATHAGRLLAAHADTVCRSEGLPGWCGEMNARAGHRGRALERLGGVVVHRTLNRTFSWVRGEPVERLTAARALPDEDVRDQPAGSSSDVRSRSTVASGTPMAAT
jgi:hypothetical protein